MLNGNVQGESTRSSFLKNFPKESFLDSLSLSLSLVTRKEYKVGGIAFRSLGKEVAEIFGRRKTLKECGRIMVNRNDL